MLSHLILSYLVLSCLVLSYLTFSYLILSYPILSYLILSYRILSYLILSYLALPYLKLTFIFSFPVLSSADLILILSHLVSFCLFVCAHSSEIERKWKETDKTSQGITIQKKIEGGQNYIKGNQNRKETKGSQEGNQLKSKSKWN